MIFILFILLLNLFVMLSLILLKRDPSDLTAADMQLEEGEITDDSDGDINPYIPLERPAEIHENAIKRLHTSDVAEDEEEEEDVNMKQKSKIPFGSCSDSDSDDDGYSGGGKRMKLNSSVPKKYTIWTKDPDDILTDVLDKIGMESPENDRNVENYPLPPGYKRYKIKRFRKRKIPGSKKEEEIDDLHPKAKPKELEDLSVNDLDSFKEVADDIASKLHEPNQGLILKIVVILGKPKAMDLYEQTKDIEGKGGMLIMNGTRKRTSGGIFIYLVRSDKEVSESQKEEIFEDKLMAACKKKKRRAKERSKKKSANSTILSNPPPSPEPSPEPEDTDLPPLPERRDIVSYEDVFMT